MSEILNFRHQVTKAFLYGGAITAMIFATGYLIDKTHQHSYDIRDLFHRVAGCEERQKQQLKK